MTFTQLMIDSSEDPKLQQWSHKIRRKFSYSCIVCEQKERADLLDDIWDRNVSRHKNLCAHHILPKTKYPEYKYDLNNGICLCQEHHIGFAHLDSVNFTLWLADWQSEIYNWVVSAGRSHKRGSPKTKRVQSYVDLMNYTWNYDELGLIMGAISNRFKVFSPNKKKSLFERIYKLDV